MQVKKVSVTNANELVADIGLSEEATALLVENISPGDYLQRLIDADLMPDAIRFLARALPKREGTWWACLSARSTIDESSKPEEIKTLELAEQWVFKPTDEHRHAAHDAAQPLENDSPVYWSAMATFWSGGSLAPPDVAAVEPADHICGMAVAGAVTLAGLNENPSESKKSYDLFFKQGIAIANGDNAKEVTL